MLVQANYGRRERLRSTGVPVGEDSRLRGAAACHAGATPGGSIIVIVGDDAPLLPGQCDRLAQRAGLGIRPRGRRRRARAATSSSAFATGNGRPARRRPGREVPLTVLVELLANGRITPLFDAVVEATEEAIVNALCAAETMTATTARSRMSSPPTALWTPWNVAAPSGPSLFYTLSKN